MIRVGSLFSQVLKLIDRNRFARAVRQHRAERGAKGFRCWDQFVAMLFCHMAGANSLREICGGPATENAVKTQLWTALIAILLLKYLQLRSGRDGSLSNLAALLRLNLLTYRDLWVWLENPFQTPIEEPPPTQRALFPM